MVVDWTSAGVGLAVGILASAAFFAGLAWSVRAALQSPRPAVLLLLSAAFRVGILLTVGYMITGGLRDLDSLAGFGLAFLIVRLIAIRWARPALAPGAGTPKCS